MRASPERGLFSFFHSLQYCSTFVYIQHTFDMPVDYRSPFHFRLLSLSVANLWHLENIIRRHGAMAICPAARSSGCIPC
jgi:hypothetical protein